MTGATGLGFLVVKQPITHSQSSQRPLEHTLNKACRRMNTTGKRLEETGMRERAYSELKRVNSIRRFLAEDAAKTLIVTSYILSRLDYYNCLLMGTPNCVIQPLQKIQNFAARLVLLAPRHNHSTPLLEKLHWLPIPEHIKYKVACMCFNAINGSGPAYLSELLHVYTPSRTLRSFSDTRML